MRYDLHLHTKYSACSRLEPKMLLKLAKKRGLHGVAVTDHNTTKGSRAVSKINKDRDFEVIISNEIKTQYGDILVYYIQEEIRSRDIFEILDKADEQDALVSIAHPFRPWFLRSVRFRYPLEKIAKRIDAIESINARTFSWENKKAERAAESLKLAKSAGSDAHFSFEVGRASTVFEGSLRDAIKKRKTKIQGSSLFIPAGITLSFINKRI